MDIVFAIIILAGGLSGTLYGVGLNGLGALFLTVLASIVVFYFWFMHEVATSTNAYGLVAWPAALIIYLFVVVLSALAGIWLVRRARRSDDQT